MVIYIKKILCLLIFFFLFDLPHIDSNSYKRLIYNTDDIYNKDYYSIYFIDTDTFELREAFSILDLEILSFIVEDEKYYARNLDILENDFLKNKSIDEVLYYMEHGIKVEEVNVVCSINEIMKLESMVDIY